MVLGVIFFCIFDVVLVFGFVFRVYCIIGNYYINLRCAFFFLFFCKFREDRIDRIDWIFVGFLIRIERRGGV